MDIFIVSTPLEMKNKKKLLSPLSILMLVIILATLCTWLIPSGRYDTLSYASGNSFSYENASGSTQLPFTQSTIDSLNIHIPLINFKEGGIKKPVSVPGTYTKMDQNKQSVLKLLQAPIKGVYDSIDIIFFVLVIGGFMQVFNESGVMVKAIGALSRRMNGRESWLIIVLSFLFCLGGASFGMAEEGLVFYPILIPVFLAAGYDLLVPVAVIFAGTQMGTLSSFSNPFSTIIASNAAGVNWSDGIAERMILFVITSAILVWYIVRYANKIKNDPSKSLLFVMQQAGDNPTQQRQQSDYSQTPPLDTRSSLLLVQFFSTFIIMIIGVVFLDWWLLEMTTLFFASSILLALVLRMRETSYISQFIEGAKGLLGVALIIGTARGVTIILNEGNISDSIIFYAANLVSSMPPALFIVMLLMMYMVFTLFISSSSGMAVLTMPIMGSLAMLVHVPGREIVNAYLFGMGIMGFITPTGLILPSLALTNISLKTWWIFIYPLLIILVVICSISLILGIYMK